MPRNDHDHIDRDHPSQRSILRIVGPMVLAVGGLFTLVGLGSFFASFGTGGMPQYFWCAFVGLPMVGIGMGLTKFAYMGAIARYMANETAPVGKDTFNYMANGTQDGVRTMTRAMGQGLSEGLGGGGLGGLVGDTAGGEASIRCHKCNHDNDPDARFCNDCGAPLAKTKPCPQCDELNDPDAKFCDNCGFAFAA